jgi:hypothetical protein
VTILLLRDENYFYTLNQKYYQNCETKSHREVSERHSKMEIKLQYSFLAYIDRNAFLTSNLQKTRSDAGDVDFPILFSWKHMHHIFQFCILLNLT